MPKLKSRATGLIVLSAITLILQLLAWAQPDAPPTDLMLTAEATTTLNDVTLVAFEYDGMRGLMPDGWLAEEAGAYVSPAQDATFVIQTLPPVPLALILPVVLGNIGVDTQPEAHSQRSANGITWALYSTTADAKPVDFALGQGSGANFLLLLQSPVGQREAWYEPVFLAMVDALAAE